MKRYIKLNNSDNHLSWGNFTRIIKQHAINKLGAMQTEIFSTIFNNCDINDTTVNNYCTGARGINSEYKQIYIIYKKKYASNKYIMIDTILNLLSLITGTIYNEKDTTKKLEIINNNKLLKNIILKLYNISKNDTEANSNLSNTLINLINNNNLYEATVNILFFIILEKKQPIYEDNLKKEVIENLLINTDVSSKELEEFLNLKFSEGINYNHSLYTMAKNSNTYALYEIACDEYKGYVKGYPRYDISYKYFKEASIKNHPGSYYMMAKMLIEGNIESKSNNDLKLAYNYLNKGIELGNIASLNLLGNMYKDGIYPVKKDINKAIFYYEKAIKHNYAYSYNNLGQIYENKKNYEKAFNYFKQSALLRESYALNKLGEYYRQGIYVDINLDKAFKYYNEAIEGPINNIYSYAYYNLAKYFYLTGNIILVKDINKAIEYLNIASNMDNVKASILLLYIYTESYLKEKDSSTLDKINMLVRKIENSREYNDELKTLIENNLNKIKNKKEISIDIIL